MMTKNGVTSDSRKGFWIQTYTGHMVVPTDPDPEQICILDIAHALSQTCRFSGHTRVFFSVAQHCCIVHDLLQHQEGGKYALEGLLHDAAEAYLVDLPRPVKEALRASGADCFDAVEDQLSRTIAEKYGLVYPWPDPVKHADTVSLVTEARDLFDKVCKDWTALFNVQPMSEILTPWTSQQAKREFLRRYYLQVA